MLGLYRNDSVSRGGSQARRIAAGSLGASRIPALASSSDGSHRVGWIDERTERMDIVGTAIAIWNAVVDVIDIASWFIP